MATLNSTFKLSKRAKTMMSFIVDPVKRNQYKRMMIDAEVSAASRARTSQYSKSDKDGTAP